MSVALDGGDTHETCDVLWLQSALFFVDVRVERVSGVVRACFAGTTTWAPPNLTWAHDLDIAAARAEDSGEVSWAGADLIERGSGLVPGIGAAASYVEHWTRLPNDRPVRAELLAGGGVAVRAGRHRLAITPAPSGALTATYRRLTPDGWRVELRVQAMVGSQ
ncbi:MAG TPA: hypothetical protein VHT97_02850 [Acidimicrobiales bacterium]|nr:hypothetical protein [Acidimicrobiales bacterium]